MAFLTASQQAAAADEQEHEAARQRELEGARQLAEAQRLRLEQQKRAARKLRKVIGVLAAVAVIAVLACIVALVARNEASRLAQVAEQEADHARQNEEKAKENAQRAEKSQKETADALAVVESQKAKAETAERSAKAAEETGRKLLYTTDMRLAPFVWRDDRTTAEQLRVLLAKHIPDSKTAADPRAHALRGHEEGKVADAKPDLRGFEWHYYQHLLQGSAAVFAGHGVSVTGGAFTANGQLVTLDENGQVRRWDLGSQDEDKASRRDLPGGPGAQISVLSPNGRLAALAEGNKIRVFDTSTGKETFQIDSANNQVRRLIFSRDNDRLVVVDEKIRWLSAVSGEVIASIDKKFQRIESLALSADGLTLAVVGYGNMGQQFASFRLDATAKKVTPLAKDVGLGGTMLASALTPDGQRIAVGAKLSGSLFFFDTGTGRMVASHGSAHASPIAAMAFSGDGAKLATADAEGTIKIWADTQKLNSKSTAFLTLKGHQGAIPTIGFSSDGKRLVTASADKTARVWDLENAGAAIRPLDRSWTPFVARFSPDGQLIATSGGSAARLWDAATGRLVREMPASDNKASIFSVAFSPTDNRLLALGYTGQLDVSYVALWDIDAGRELARLPAATDPPDFRMDQNTGMVSALAFSPDGKYLVAGFGSKNVYRNESLPVPLKVWEVATRRLIRRLNGHTNFCVSLDFSRDGKLLASGSRDGTSILWSTQTWNKAQTLQNPDKDSLFSAGLRGMVEDVAFSPDGKTLALASREGNVHLWDVATGKLLETLKGHSSAVRAVVFSPDGRTLASGSGDQTVRLWNVETGRQLMQLDPGGVELGQVQTLAFSPDGKRLLAGGSSRAAFWSAAPIIWNDPELAAAKLRLVLKSNADFPSRIRMLSENLRLHETLAKLDAKDVRVQAALAATRANWHASQKRWVEAAKEVDRLLAADKTSPEAWLRTPGLLRLATALVHQNRPTAAAMLLQGDAKLRSQDPANARVTGFGLRFEVEEGAFRLKELEPNSPASRSKLLTGDVIVKLDGVEMTKLPIPDLQKKLNGKAGAKLRLTVRHPGKTQMEDVDLVAENYRVDAATGELLSQLQAALEKRLAKDPKDAGLLELRAEFAGEDSDFARQFKEWNDQRENLGHFRFSVSGEPAALDKTRNLFATAKLTDPWQKLAVAYRLQGDQKAIDQLVKRRPKLAGPIGDLFTQGKDEDKDWRRAVEIYSRGITAQTTDAELLSKRASAHETLKNWDAAAADWSRAASGNPDGANLLAEFARRLVAGNQIALAKAQFEKPQALYEQALKRDPGSDLVAEELAQLLFDKLACRPGDLRGQFVRLDLPGDNNQFPRYAPDRDKKTINLAELQVFHGDQNIALRKKARQSTDGYPNGRGAENAVDGNTRGEDNGPPYAHTAWESDPWWEVDLGSEQAIDRIVVWNRSNPDLYARMNHFRIRVLDRSRNLVFERVVNKAPSPSTEIFPQVPQAEVADVEARLAASYALNGRSEEAVARFGTALRRAEGYEARKPILELAARFDEVIAALSKRQPDDPQLQLALARNLAERGKQRLLEREPAKAQAELEKSREMLTRLREGPKWAVLTPTELKSQGGETLTVEKDGSIFVSGPNPNRAVYTLKFRTDLPTLTAIRLETIPDARLPGSGAGRYGNGNFHVAEFTAAIVSGQPDVKPIPVEFGSAMADYSQDTTESPKSIDGDPRTRWDVHPRMKDPHWVVFVLKSPARMDGGSLSITLDSGISEWGYHSLGRFRLSAMNDADLTRAVVRNDLKDSEVVDLNVALAKAHAGQGHINEAVILFAEAFDLATDRAAKAKIITEAAALQGVLEKLTERAAGDAQFQAELARHFAERCNAPLADASRAKARALFEEKLAKEPQNTALAADLADLLLIDSRTKWTILKPTQIKSQGGATLTLLDDSSILAGGKNPDRDVYSLVAKSDLKQINAVRLEALPDPSLPNGGPGRHPNGNFNLGELRVFSGGQRVTLTNIIAAYDETQEFRNVIAGRAHATRGWSNYPRAGQTNTAIIATHLERAPDDDLKIEMYFSPVPQWTQAGLGRFRLSISGDPKVLEHESNRFAILKLTDPWAKLAAAYHVLSDQRALDKLLEHHPTATAGIGDLYASRQDWQRALVEYNKAITKDSKDARIFAARAEAYQKLEKWELAAADWGNADLHASDK